MDDTRRGSRLRKFTLRPKPLNRGACGEAARLSGDNGAFPATDFFGDRIRRMIRIAITPAAYAAIAATLALGTVAVEPERAQDGGVHIWLDPGVLAKLKARVAPARATATSS